jgi:hypothetical protein
VTIEHPGPHLCKKRKGGPPARAVEGVVDRSDVRDALTKSRKDRISSRWQRSTEELYEENED